MISQCIKSKVSGPNKEKVDFPRKVDQWLFLAYDNISMTETLQVSRNSGPTARFHIGLERKRETESKREKDKVKARETERMGRQIKCA